MKIDSLTKNFIIETIKSFLNLEESYSIILFGSCAAGNPRSASDIDISIKTSKPLDLHIMSQIREQFDESDIPQTIDLIDYHRVTDAFKKVIDAKGFILFEKRKS